MISPRAEHVLVERIVPALLIAIVPLLAIVYVAGEQGEERSHEAAVASCERGNVLRDNEVALIAYLIQVGQHIQDTTESVETLAFFQKAQEDLVQRAVALSPVDCEKDVP